MSVIRFRTLVTAVKRFSEIPDQVGNEGREMVGNDGRGMVGNDGREWSGMTGGEGEFGQEYIDKSIIVTNFAVLWRTRIRN